MVMHPCAVGAVLQLAGWLGRELKKYSNSLKWRIVRVTDKIHHHHPMKTSLVRASAFGTLLLTFSLTSCVDPYGYGYGGGWLEEAMGARQPKVR
jgi:hypothetical protein